jgi:hypothetical protein
MDSSSGSQPPTDPAAWRRWRFPPDAADAWQAVGVADPAVATKWGIAGVTPATIDDWRQADLDADQAVKAFRLGYDLAAVRELASQGRDVDTEFARRYNLAPTVGHVAATVDVREALRTSQLPQSIVVGFLHENWLDQEALRWATYRIEVADARSWRAMGLTPAEAADLQQRGRRPGEVAREWHEAGIPPDELAEWLGAGYSAAEAASERARGVPIEEVARTRMRRQDLR